MLTKTAVIVALKFAAELAKAVLQMKSDTSIAIGINGEWGSGKSSLMEMLKYTLENDDLIHDVGDLKATTTKPALLSNSLLRKFL